MKHSRTHEFDSLPDTGYITMLQLTKGVIPVSKATLRRWVAAGHFPSPVELSPGLHAFLVADVRAWMASRPAPSRPREFAGNSSARP